MTQAEFKLRMAKSLAKLSAERRREIEEDIAGHFAEGFHEGLEESALCAMLGEPEALAKEYLMQSVLSSAQEKTTLGNTFRVLWAGIGMGMLNLIFALPILVSIFAVWLSIAITAVALLLSGAFAVIAAPLYTLPFMRDIMTIDYPVIAFFGGVSITALGGLAAIFSGWLGKRLLRGLLKYVKVNLDVIIGRRQEA